MARFVLGVAAGFGAMDFAAAVEQTAVVAPPGGDAGAANATPANRTDPQPAEQPAALNDVAPAPDVAPVDGKPPVNGKPPTDNKPPEKKPAVNPVERLLKDLFNPDMPSAHGDAENAVQNPDDESAGTGGSNAGQRFVDPHAATDKQHLRLFVKGREQSAAGNWGAAIRSFQVIADSPNDSLVPDNGRYVSAWWLAQFAISSAPATALEQYRQQFEGLAARDLKEAISNKDSNRVARLAAQYLNTAAGQLAADMLASQAADRNDPMTAVIWYRRLLQVPAAIPFSPVRRQRIVAAFRRCSLNSAADELSQLDLSDPKVAVSQLHSIVRHDPAPQPISAIKPQTDWPCFFGNSRRHTIVSGSEPVLLPRYSHSITSSQSMRDQISSLQEDLLDQKIPPLCSIYPVVSAGRLAVRTLAGVNVYDSATGQLAWTTDDIVPVEMQLLAAGRADDDDGPDVNNRWLWTRHQLTEYASGSFDQHPLAHLLLRNSNWGLISCDSNQLYMAEDGESVTVRQLGQGWEDDDVQSPERYASWLVAFDLKSGVRKWVIGGPADDPADDPPLAGAFFFGPPVRDGDDLFVIVQIDPEIRLVCLRPADGTVRWSQTIGVAGSSMRADLGRRWRTAQPAVSGDMVICPTTQGWLTAVDRKSRSLIWGVSYVGENGQRNHGGDEDSNANLVENEPAAQRWAVSAPVVCGNVVILTPPETHELIAIRRMTGTVLWRKPAAEATQLVGVHHDLVVVSGPRETVAYHVSTGERRWKTPHSLPAGRGALLADSVCIPLVSGELLRINARNGSQVGRQRLPPESPSLGNLTVASGLLISVGLNGVGVFEQRAAVLAEIERIKKISPDDSAAKLREAELALLNDDALAARRILTAIKGQTLDSLMSARVQLLLRQSVMRELRQATSTPARETAVAALRELSLTEAERDELAWIELDQAVRDGAPSRLFSLGLPLLRELDRTGKLAASPPVFDRSGQPDSRTAIVSPRFRIAGLLADAWSNSAESQREELTSLVAAYVAELPPLAGDKTPDYENEVRRLQPVLFHPLGQSRGRALAERLMASSPATSALLMRQVELHSLRFGALPSPAKPSSNEQDQPADAEPPEPAAATAAAPAPNDQTPVASGTGLSTGGLFVPYTVEQLGATYTGLYSQDLSQTGSVDPSFRKHRLLLHCTEQRLEMIDDNNPAETVTIPLRGRGESNDGVRFPVLSFGPWAVIIHRSVLQLVSLVEKRVVWSTLIDTRGSNPMYFGMQNSNPTAGFERLSRLHQQFFISPQPHAERQSDLVAANEQIVVVLDRHGVTVYDTITGDIRWKSTEMRRGSSVCAAEGWVFLRDSQGKLTAFRSIDGTARSLSDSVRATTRLDETIRTAVQPTLQTADATVVDASRSESADGPIPTPVDQKKSPTERPGIASLRVPDEVTLRFDQPVAAVGTDLILVGESVTTPELGTAPLVILRIDPVTRNTAWSYPVSRQTRACHVEANRLAVLDENRRSLVELDLRTGTAHELGELPLEVTGKRDLAAIADAENIYLLASKAQSTSFFSDQLPFVRVNGRVAAFSRTGGGLLWMRTVENQHLVLSEVMHIPVLVFMSRRYESQGMLQRWLLDIQVINKQTGQLHLQTILPSQPGLTTAVLNVPAGYIEFRGYSERLRIIQRPASGTAAQDSPAANSPRTDAKASPPVQAEPGAMPDAAATTDTAGPTESAPATTPAPGDANPPSGSSIPPREPSSEEPSNSNRK